MTDYSDLLAATRAVVDPSTSGADLAAIAQAQPGLRVQVAVHPNTYPGLLAWLGEYGDETVRRVVASRAAPPPPPVVGPPVPLAAPAPLVGEPSPVKKPKHRALLIAVLAAVVVIAGAATTWAVLAKRETTAPVGIDGLVALTSAPTVTHWDCPAGSDGRGVGLTTVPNLVLVSCSAGGDESTSALVNKHGKTVWSCPDNGVMSVLSTPGKWVAKSAPDTLAVTCQTDGGYDLYAINKNGHEAWNHPLSSSERPSVVDGGDGTWAVRTDAHELLLVDAAKGSVRTQTTIDEELPTLLLFDGHNLITYVRGPADEDEKETLTGYAWTSGGEATTIWTDRYQDEDWEGSLTGCEAIWSFADVALGGVTVSCPAQTLGIDTPNFFFYQDIVINPATGELDEANRAGLTPLLHQADVDHVLAAAGTADGDNIELHWADNTTLVVVAGTPAKGWTFTGVEWPSLTPLWEWSGATDCVLEGGAPSGGCTSFNDGDVYLPYAHSDGGAIMLEADSAYDVFDARTGYGGRLSYLDSSMCTVISGIVYMTTAFDDATKTSTITAYAATDVTVPLWELALPPDAWIHDAEATSEYIVLSDSTGVTFLTP
ncbi:MAG: hypothetical protein LBI33_07370 [Propionibacteriaceae bacterium]|jgi:hypothetical protein|nr:hypothetical protein [Propionibacteriaceae bacterium]